MKTKRQETAEDACRSELLKIERLLAVMQDEIKVRAAREATWPLAGTLTDTRKWLTDTLGILTGMDTADVEGFLNETDRPATYLMTNAKGRRVRVTIPHND